METVGDERVRAAKSLRELEEAAQLLEDASKLQAPEKVSPGFPSRISGVLNELTTISSRDDAERLLALGKALHSARSFMDTSVVLWLSLTLIAAISGVSMWNSVIAFECHGLEQSAAEALVKVRHVAADCMYMSTAVLGGISARYSIDNLSLLKFYTACGQRYSADLGDTEMAEVCFSKAAEFAEATVADKSETDFDENDYSKAMFDLLLGRAECAWEKGDSGEAEGYVTNARDFLEHLPEEYEFLASVEYNFGLFTYQQKDTNRALRWLERSIATRGSKKNSAMNAIKQARTMRLAGVCRLALQEYEESWKLMKKAEEVSHDPVGTYLLLKLSVITKKSEAADLLLETIDNRDSTLEVCIAALCLFTDAQRIAEAAAGYEKLFRRFQEEPKAIVCSVGPRFFETLSALGKMDEAINVLNVCTCAIDRLDECDIDGSQNQRGDGRQSEVDETSRDVQLSRWSALLLAAGSALADRKDFAGAAELLDRAISLSRKSRKEICAQSSTGRSDKELDPLVNVVKENEAAVCRLAASCALCSIGDISSPVSMSLDDKVVTDGPQALHENDRKVLTMAKRHSQRAKELEPNDFTPRLLLFRVHLVSRDFRAAAAELQTASADIRSFDPGAVAEAACAARDIGSTEAVIAALRCILKLDPAVMSASLESSGSLPPKGFFGTVLLSCVSLLLKVDKNDEDDPSDPSRKASSPPSSPSHDKKHGILLETLEAGQQGLEFFGFENSFLDEDRAKKGIAYLMDVAWNMGRKAGSKLEYANWESFFRLCYGFSAYLPTDMDTLQTRRMSKVMCACAKIENPDSTKEDFTVGTKDLNEARHISKMMQELSPTPGGDPIDGLLFILEARCCVGCRNVDSLAAVIEVALLNGYLTPGALEQLAAICHNFPKLGDSCEGTRRSRCTDLCTALLSKATDARLCKGKEDVEAVAVTMREHFGIELARGANAARSFKVFEKAVGVVLEFGETYPHDERRWFVAVGWDRAQMHKHLGQNSEAKRWCELVLQMTEGVVSLSTYRPRLLAFLKCLATA